MTIHLPKPIEIYLASERAHDISALEQCMAADATVRDESQTIQGLEAIKAWRQETGRKYSHTVEPLATADRDGKVVVTCKVTGSFPGSPVHLDHIFEIEGDRIVALEIH